MGNHRTKGQKGTHTGAPLTRRQQKQQRRNPKQQRQAQTTMPPAQQQLRHQPEMRVGQRPADRAQPAVQLDAGDVARVEIDTISDKGVTSMIADIEAVTTEAADDVQDASVARKKRKAPARDGDQPTPRGNSRARAAARPDAAESAAAPEKQRTTKPVIPAARKPSTKYPTLARMASIAPTASPSASAPAPLASQSSAASLPPPVSPAAFSDEPDLEEDETLEMLSSLTSRIQHTGETDASHFVARDDAPEMREPDDVFAPRKPVTTRRLSQSAQPSASDVTARRLESAAAKAVAGTREAQRQASKSSQASLANAAAGATRRPQPLPELDLVLPVVAGHIIVAFVSALIGAIIMITGDLQAAIWPFALTAALGVGAWLAFLASKRDTAKSFAGTALLISQLAVLGWAFALLGPRASLLALAPALLLLALRTTGAFAMSLGAGATFALYVVAMLFAPVLPIPGPILSPTELAIVDGVAVFVGILTLLLLALDLQSGRTRALAHARASRHEARLLRERSAQLRQQLEEDAALLDEGLGEALYGRGIDPAAMEQVDSMLSPLVERIVAVAERMETLQRDREDRLRLEGAVRQVTRALERGWLGLPWSWPDSSGTLLDELVALLRAPNPRQMPLWREETPPMLVPIPSIEPGAMSHPSWEAIDTPVINPYVRSDMRPNRPAASNYANYASLPEHSGHSITPTRGISGTAWPVPLRGDEFTQQHATEGRPAPVRANPLPWEEWDTWGVWDAAAHDSRPT